MLVSPVAPTNTHPEAQSLGWAGLAALTRDSRLPVYALGGMEAEDLPAAVTAGCIGIAAITAAWREPARMSAANARRCLADRPAL